MGQGIYREYTIKGWIMDDARIKLGTYLMDKYFIEQLERIREILASERLFYQKITCLCATAVDYDKNSASTKRFYAAVQNKMHYGNVGKELILLSDEESTASEIIISSYEKKSVIGSSEATVTPTPKPTPTVSTLVISYNPSWANIFIDNNYKRFTPPTQTEIAPGTHLVILKKEGYLNDEQTIKF